MGKADPLERARDAVARAAWPEAYEAFAEVDLGGLGAHDVEGYAEAAWWCSRLRESIDLRHRAYAAYASQGDERSAAALAARLAIEHFVQGEPSVGSGFLRRAHRHAEAVPIEAGHGFLAMVDSTVARFAGNTDLAVDLAHQAIEIGRRTGDADLVAMAVHAEGVALIEAGRIEEGLPLVDEAMAAVLAGDVSPYFTGIMYCDLIGACLEIGDLRRAGEWSDASHAWLETIPPGSPFPGMCRVNRAEVARLRGAWAEAESEALLACEELSSIDPDVAASAFQQLGEVRRRTGDLKGAEAAFEQAVQLGVDPQPGLALLRLAQGKREAARTAVRLALGGETHPVRRARLLAAQVEIDLAAGDVDGARAAADELRGIVADARTPWLEAASAFADGLVALAGHDLSAAVAKLRRACVTWHDLKLPYEAARARARYGEALRAAGDEDGARLEFRAAHATFERLGATPDATASDRLLGGGAYPSGLSAREVEVLRLVAAGKTNRDIAVELVISEHTVGRHLQNIYAKLGVSTRAAATAFAFEHGLT